MNYVSRYNLEFNPFIKNSKETLILLNAYKEIKFRLDYLLNTRGFGLITGDPGSGKTTAVRNWSNSLNASAYKIIYIPMSTLTVNEAYKQLAMSLGIMPLYRKVDNFKEIQAAIRRSNIEKKVIPIIIFDEANYMSQAMLNDLKMLFNFDMDSKDLAVVILVGLPILNNILTIRSNEPLKQRIVTSYNIDSLNQEEANKYITGKLKAAGCNNEVFSESAIKAITSYCNGSPRLISKLCNTALLIGDTNKVNIIDEEIVMKAIDEVEI